MPSETAYLSWRMAAKLTAIPEFDSLPEPVANPCPSCIKQWRDAIITILSWQDNGAREVSKEFRDFYNGLRYFRNANASTSEPLGEERLQRQLFGFIFEAFGSNPSDLPKVIREILDIWVLIPRDFREGSKANLWNIITHEKAITPPEFQTLQRYLHSRTSDLWRQIKRSAFPWAHASYNRLSNLPHDDPSLDLPMADGFNSLATHALELCRRKSLTMMRNLRVKPSRRISSEDSPPESKIHLYVGPSGCGKTHKIRQKLNEYWGLYLLPGTLPTKSQSDTPQSLQDQTLFDELSYQPHRSGGSRDTQTWYNDLIMIADTRCNALDCWTLAVARMQALVHLRLWVLEDFLRVFPKRHTPADWLKFQTSFENARDDILNDLYRIAIFSETFTKHLAGGRPMPVVIQRRLSNLFICIDEAQCDIKETFLATSHSDFIHATECEWFSLLTCTVRVAAQAALGTVNPNNFQMIISGTALQLKPTVEILMGVIPYMEYDSWKTEFFRRLYLNDARFIMANLNEYLERFGPDTISFQEPEFSVRSQFPLIRKDSEFKTLLEARIRISRCVDQFQRIIIEKSRPLRGRYQWSVSYLKEIENVMKRRKADNEILTENDAAECCRRVYDQAKDGLKRRLKEIDERFWNEMSYMIQDASLPYKPDLYAPAELRVRYEQLAEVVNELCLLAIRSDLLGESTIFRSKESAEMIAQGFAFIVKADFVDTRDGEAASQNEPRTKGKIMLRERIAVEAAVEYFQAERPGGKPSRYDEALEKILYQEQKNASALGKSSELFFAWHLRKVLQVPEQPFDVILPIFSREERMKVLDILVGQAKNLEKLLQMNDHSSGGGDLFRNRVGCDPDQVALIEGNQTAFAERNGGDRSETMWGWMKKVRERCPKDSLTSTFWFPSNSAGPDVLFALKRTTSHDSKSSQSTGQEPSTSERRRIIDNSIVLCVVQIKRQTTNHDIAGAILSTSPNHWFRHGSNSEAKSILHELREWRIEGYPIVRILVTALTNPGRKQPKGYLKEEKNKAPTRDRFRKTSGQTENQSPSHPDERNSENFRASEIPLDQQYFNWVGAEHDGDLFGAAFSEFNRAERNL